MGRYVGIGVRPAGRVGSNPVFPLLNLLNLKKIRRAYDRAWRIFTKFTYPTGNLDSENEENIVELLKGLAHERDYLVIVVTHNPEVARQADVCLKMKDGRMV